MQTKLSFFQFEMPQFALSASFEYLFYGSTTIIIILILSARVLTLAIKIGRLQTSDPDV